MRHSLAHLLAAAVLELWPDTKTAIGPAIDNGFYYDFEFSKPLSDKDLSVIQKKMKKMLNTWDTFSEKKVSEKEAKDFFKDNPYKQELIDEIVSKKEDITLYTSGPPAGGFTDLCKGGHIEDMKKINADAFKLSHIAGAYWRGDENNTQLTRIYGLAFETKKDLDEYEKMLAEAKERDHRKLGKELGLFVFSDIVGKGLPLWTDKGATIRREVERFIVDEEIRRGYKHVRTPDMARIDLYKKSGHYPYYKDSMYTPMVIDEDEYMLRPMTCPHHFELYLSKPRSYRELPLRIAELAQLYRYEQSGELSGLMRVRSFCLADAHIICRDTTQAQEEVDGALDLIEYIAKVFGLNLGENYSYRLSLGNRDEEEKYFKDDNAWDVAEGILRNVLKKRRVPFVEAQNEASFYGPKIDIQMKNVLGKEDTAFTVQYDFVMPKRFELTFTDSDGKEKEPIVIHRSSVGAIERIMAFLIEHYAGSFPLWLSPTQVAVLPIAEDKHGEYAKEVYDALLKLGIRVEWMGESESLGKRIRQSKMQKIPYLVVIGDKEIEYKKITVEGRDNERHEYITMADFITLLENKIKNKK